MEKTSCQPSRAGRSAEREIARAIVDLHRQSIRAWEDQIAGVFDQTTQQAPPLSARDFKLLASAEGRVVLSDLWDRGESGIVATATELSEARLAAMNSETSKAQTSDGRYRKIEDMIAAGRRAGLVEDALLGADQKRVGNSKPLRATQKLDELMLSLASFERQLIKAIAGPQVEAAMDDHAQAQPAELREWKS